MNLTFRTIIVATDFGDASSLALEYGRVLAARFGADIRLLHIVDTPRAMGTEIYLPEAVTLNERALADAQQLMAETLATFRNEPVVGQVLVGHPAQKIVEYATDHDVDLIVMGTHGRGGLAQMLMGSVAERVVRTAPCPVFTVRQAAVFDRVEEEKVAVAVG
jgi:nucleotide-binding universal stress UspA family protein